MFDKTKNLIAKRRKRVKIETRQLRGAKRRLENAKQRLARLRARKASDSLFCGIRGVTNRVIDIVNGRARVTSRKRAANHPLSLSNPSSDHNCRNRCSDAVDFGIAEAHSLADEIADRLGGPSNIVDFQNFTITHGGQRFNVQIIAGTHGTGPHLHVGVRRA
jgi:hypothetical protein